MAKKEQFGERLIEACCQVNEQMKSEDPFGPMDAEGWYTWNGDTMIRPAGIVETILADGYRNPPEMADKKLWSHGPGDPGNIVKWRPAR